MTLDEPFCQEGERLNVQLVREGEDIVVDPAQTRADYSYRVVEGTEQLTGESPWEKLVEVITCAERHAEVEVVGDSLQELI